MSVSLCVIKSVVIFRPHIAFPICPAQDLVNDWTLYSDGAKQLSAAIDTADGDYCANVGHTSTVSAVPVHTLELIMSDRTVMCFFC